MGTFAVAYMSFFDNELIIEVVTAETPEEALWRHSKLQDPCWEEATAEDDLDAMKECLWNTDILVNVIEINEKTQRGAWSIEAALALADSFSEACETGQAIPGWALALRALADRVRLAIQVASMNSLELALFNAAVANEAYAPGQIVAMLLPMTSIRDGEVWVDFADYPGTPDEVVKRMREGDAYLCLFLSHVVPGVGHVE
jgi:hypothetical protein